MCLEKGQEPSLNLVGSEKNLSTPELIEQPDLINGDMHSLFLTIFKTLVKRQASLSVSKICKMYTLKGIGLLKRVP